MAVGSRSERDSSALKVLCLESWSGDLRHRESVRPLLDVLAEQAPVAFIHRTIDSRAQLVDYLARWSRLKSYRVCYLACHGRAGKVYIGGDEVGLLDLAKELRDEHIDLSGQTLYLGSCDVMGVPRKVLKEVRQQSGLACLCGYSGDEGVDWLESAAFELLLFRALALSGYAQTPYALRDLKRDHAQLSRHLNFEYDPLAPAARHGSS